MCKKAVTTLTHSGVHGIEEAGDDDAASVRQSDGIIVVRVPMKLQRDTGGADELAMLPCDVRCGICGSGDNEADLLLCDEETRQNACLDEDCG